MSEVSIPQEMLDHLRQQAAILRNLQQTARIGWWKVDFDERTFYCSDILQNLLQFERMPVAFEDFRRLIHPDHRERVIRQFTLFADSGLYDEEFPVQTRMGYMWLHSRLGTRELDAGGHSVAEGYMQYVEPEAAIQSRAETAQVRLRELLNRHNSLSQSLLTLLKDPDSGDVITETLENLLYQFDGDRVYIFEYDWDKGEHSCTYEVTQPNIAPEINRLQHMSIDDSPWWNAQIVNHVPIVLNDLGMLPAEAVVEKEVLAVQGIRSLIVVPLVSHAGTWGYLGIDMVGRSRIWSEMDQQWFLSISNIISVCMELKKSEMQVRREKEYFRNLYINMPMGYIRLRVIFDRDGRPADYRFVEVNPAFEALTMIPGDETLGRSIREFMPLITDEMLGTLDKVALDSSVVSSRQTMLVGERYFSTTIFSSDAGYCTLLFTDITESIEAYNALRRSEDMLQNIYNGIPVGIEIYDKQGTLLDINAEDMRIFGLGSKDGVMGINLFDNPNVPEHAKEAFRNKQPIEFTLDYDFRAIRYGGYYDSAFNEGVKNLFVKGTILYDSANNVERYILIVVDNTDSLTAYRQLHEFEELFSYMAEVAQVGLCHWTPARGEFTASPQWRNNVNYRREEFVSIDDVYAQVHPGDKAKLDAFFAEAMAGREQGFRNELRVKDGADWKWIRCTYRAKAAGDGSSDMELLGLNIDITELKQTELRLREAKAKAEESDRLKSAFLANMSHEIRTPLNAIVGFSELVAHTEDAAERDQYVEIIGRNNELLLQLISDILDLSKIEAGMIEMVHEPVDANALCETVVGSCMSTPAHPVAVLFDEHPAACTIHSDWNKLFQVLTNLVSNALKFTAEGSVHVGYRLRPGEIEFYVRDTGIGIAPEQVGSVFNRFVKLNSFSQGTGLGLSICKQVVERLGGRIGVDSELGKGSCFWFVLPCESVIYDGGGGGYSSDPEGRGRPDRPLILIAEDTDSNYLLISSILKADYDLIRARNGAEAVLFFAEQHPDLVLMDVKMPVMDGFEATRRIRRSDMHTPIIIVTAHAFADDREKAAEAGGTDFMSKPIDVATLRSLMASILGSPAAAH